MYNFPNIILTKDMPELPNSNSNSLPEAPKRMHTLLRNKNIIPNSFLNGINNMAILEATIVRHIDNFQDYENIEKIFHLIQIWGGLSGRGIYVRQQFIWREFEPAYRSLVDVCRSIEKVNHNSCEKVYCAVSDFLTNLKNIGYKGMGVAFTTKHVRFWMHKNLPDNMLPIYDSTFSENLTHEGRYATIKHLKPFWIAMIKKSEETGIGLTSLERQLFNYYQSNKSLQ